MTEKNIVLDTNILIGSPDCLITFIPDREDKQVNIILNTVVIVELDNNKSGFSAKAVGSRQASRKIKEVLSFGGVIGKNCNLILIEDSFGIDEKSYMGHDKIIIETAVNLMKQGKEVELVTNDTNVEILAKAKGINSNPYKHELVDTTSIYEEVKSLKYSDLTDELIQKLNENLLTPEDINLKMIPNEALVLENSDIFKYKNGKLIRMDYPKPALGIKPKNIEQQIFMSHIQDEDVRIAVSISKAGSGKSVVALACALEMVEKGLYEKVVVLKPTIAMADESVGYLKGELREGKTLPLFENTFDSLEAIYNLKKSTFVKDGQKIKNDGFSIFEQLYETGKMDVKLLTHMRGTSKSNCIYILEEFQSLHLNAVKSVLTRLSDSSKAIVCSDISQIDNRFLNEKNNGVTLMVDKLRGQDFFSFVNLKTSVRGKVCDIISDLL